MRSGLRTAIGPFRPVSHWCSAFTYKSPLTQSFGLGVNEETSTEHLDRLEAFFKERGAPVFHEVSPMADTSLLSLLGERGYRPIELTSVMYRPLQDAEIGNAVAISGITTRPIEESEADVWAQTAARGSRVLRSY